MAHERTGGRERWVFHQGALGDSVLLWPLLRALAASGPVTLVTDGAKGRLAARELGVEAVDGDGPPWSELWHPDGECFRIEGVRAVDAFLGRSAADRWLPRARAAFPGAAIRLHRDRPDARLARRWAQRAGAGGGVSEAGRADGPVALHVGAGAAEKSWSVGAWLAVAAALRDRFPDRRVALIAGEAEAERHDRAERARFAAAGGTYLTDLPALEEATRQARLFSGADTGPTHLAAQLGVPTVALFGPTDPHMWAPVGPAVTVVAPPEPRPMTWLGPAEVVAWLSRELAP